MSEIDASRYGGDDADDDYAAAYLDDDQADDDEDLAEMFAKVQSIQETEGRRPTVDHEGIASVDLNRGHTAHQSSDGHRDTSFEAPPSHPILTVSVTVARNEPSSWSGTPKAILSRSPSTMSSAKRIVRKERSADGIKTISRHSAHGGPLPKDALLGPRKPQIFDEKILQAALSADVVERLKQQAVAAPPARIAVRTFDYARALPKSVSLTTRLSILCVDATPLHVDQKRIETLSAPLKKDLGRRFATDDEERHCRFQAKKSAARKAAEKDGYDGDNQDSTGFIARMEAAERNRQKKLEVTRGENEYNARVDKKCCPKCGVPQSYSEYHDKKKRCQTCGVEFLVPQAWGDVGQAFISRMTDAVRAQAEKNLQLRARVEEDETQSNRVAKTARQRFYEKQLSQKSSQRTFLDRNYRPNSSSKVKQAEQEIQALLAKKRPAA